MKKLIVVPLSILVGTMLSGGAFAIDQSRDLAAAPPPSASLPATADLRHADLVAPSAVGMAVDDRSLAVAHTVNRQGQLRSYKIG